MFRFDRAIFEFIRTVDQLATPIEVVEALDDATRRSRGVHGVRLWAIFYKGRPGLPHTYIALNKNTFYPKSAPEVFRSGEYMRLLEAHGGGALHDFARTRSTAFTLSRALNRIGTRGKDRWPFELFLKNGIRDGLYCPVTQWMVLYRSPNVLCLELESRIMLTQAASAAVGRIERLVRNPMALKPKTEPSEREKAVLRLKSHGKTAAQIAEELGLSEATARHHLEKVRRKLGARDVTEAVAEALRRSFIS